MKSLVNCALCNKEFLKCNYRISVSTRHYCSRVCACQANSTIKWSRQKKQSKHCKKCNIVINNRNINNHCIKCYRDLGLNKLSENTKKLLSEKRKQFLRNNPDKHPWKLKNKFKSEPCENFKKILRENNFSFIEEFTPNCERNYSIDIVFPEKMIGIEINGNQHYERNGKLKQYYQDRHDYIESLGWKLYEIHYSLCFDQEYVLNLINQILAAENKVQFNYEEYVQQKLEKKNLYSVCKCGNKIRKQSKHCNTCQQINRRKVKRPEKDQLHYMIWNDSALQISKQFNVCDNTIKNWCKMYKLNKPPVGYWEKIRCGSITDYQI